MLIKLIITKVFIALAILVTAKKIAQMTEKTAQATNK